MDAWILGEVVIALEKLASGKSELKIDKFVKPIVRSDSNPEEESKKDRKREEKSDLKAKSGSSPAKVVLNPLGMEEDMTLLTGSKEEKIKLLEFNIAYHKKWMEAYSASLEKLMRQ